MRLYHFSYDVIDVDKDFGGSHEKVRDFLICKIKPFTQKIQELNRTTWLLEVEKYDPEQIKFFYNLLTGKFYFVVTLVSLDSDYDPIGLYDGNDELNDKFQIRLTEVDCKKILGGLSHVSKS